MTFLILTVSFLILFFLLMLYFFNVAFYVTAKTAAQTINTIIWKQEKLNNSVLISQKAAATNRSFFNEFYLVFIKNFRWIFAVFL